MISGLIVRFLNIFIMKKPEEGDKIPNFELYDQNEELFRLNEHLGDQNLVIYFYPKDDTPGCTAEACGFRDHFEEFINYDCQVIGISADDTKSHKNFAEKHQLPFILLSDPENGVRRKFGVPRSMLGMLPGRVTYIVDKNGVIQHIFNSQFRTNQHVNEAINLLKQL